MPPKKKGGKKGGKAAADWGSDDDLAVDPLAAASATATAASDDDEDDSAPAPAKQQNNRKQKQKKKAAPSAAAAFALLADDDEAEEAASGEDEGDAEDEDAEERSPSPPRRASAAASFAALGLGDDGAGDDDDSDESEKEEEVKREEERKRKQNSSMASIDRRRPENDAHPLSTSTPTHTQQQPSSLVVAARVLSIERHPDADKLSVLTLDAGTAGGDSYKGRPRRVVTNAAAQLEAGDIVVLALPGFTLPGGSKAAVSRATVRGVASEGMLCSGADLCWCDDDDDDKGSAASSVPARLEGSGAGAVVAPGSRVACGPGSIPPDGALFGSAADRVAAKERKRAKKAAAATAAAAALAALDDSSAAAAADASPSQDLREATKKKKKKSTADFGAALAALEEEANGETTTAADAPADASATAAADAEAEAPSKKPKKKKSTADLDALMAQIEGDGGGEEKQKEKEKDKKKDKKKKDKGGEPEPEAASSSSPSSAAAAAPAALPAAAAKDPEATGDPEIDALLFNIENPSSSASSTAASKKAKKKAKKAAAAGAGGVDDLDAALAELGLDTPAAAASSSSAAPAAAAADGGDFDDEAFAASAAAGTGGEPKELSAAQKKKLKKKAKEKAAKSGDGGGGVSEAADAADAAAATAAEEEAAAAASPSKKGGGKPAKGPSAAVRRLQEELEARKRAEAAAARAEAERVAAEEAEIAAQEAEEARKAADAEARRQRQKERRAELKKQGLLLTGKAKKEAERLAAVREQFLKSSGGGAAGAAAGGDDDEGGAGEKRPKKAVYEKKKKQGGGKGGPPLSSAPSSAPSEAAEVAAEEEEAAARKEKEEEAKAATAAAAAAEEASTKPEPEAKEEDDDDAADAWDELDLDEVVLPVKKSRIDDDEEASSSSSSEEEEAEAEAAKPAAATAVAAAKKKPAVLTAAEKKKAADAKAAAAKAALAASKAAPARPKKAANGGAKAAKAAASSDEEEDDGDDDEEAATSSEEEDEETESESESESDSDDSDSDDDSDDSEEARERALDASKQRRAARWDLAKARADPNRLRSPICCILGHVDTGKTKLLDNVRRTSVQEGEAGGITQQIGATYIPADAVVKRTAPLRVGGGEAAPSASSASGAASSDALLDLCAPLHLRLPGLLVIDTPGHESFSNLRSRGSGLCDVAVLVVDLMHGLEPQTIESINLLKSRKTPFIVALNKVDRLFDWKPLPDGAMRTSLESQQPHVRGQFDKQVAAATLALNEQGLNVALYWDNPDPRKYVSLVPTSAITGEGVPDLLHVLATVAQSRRLMGDRLVYVDEPQVSVLEVKVIEGLGTTVDVVLVNGRLREGDTVVACGLGGPLVATVRSLLTPHPLRELRVKGSYQHHREVEGAQGVKICAHGLESAVAGTALLVARTAESSHQSSSQIPPGGGLDDIEALKLEAMEDMQDIFASVDRSGEGVCAQASTLGSLEALLEFLRSDAVKIPVTGIAIGPVHKRDVMRASVMLEKGQKKYAAVLAFDVPVTREARELADELGVRVFTADIIYHLFDQFTEYMRLARREEADAAKAHAAFPCVLKILPACVFNKRDPIVLGVEVEEGTAAVGTPLCVPTQGGFELGRIASLELNHKAVDRAHRGDSVAMKIEATNSTEAARLYGRHFDHNDRLVSKLTRKSIDVLKEHFREDLGRDDWILVVKLKKLFGIE